MSHRNEAQNQRTSLSVPGQQNQVLHVNAAQIHD